MDDIDFSISMLLMVNSRMPYKELAEIFKISVNSIHKRVNSLVNKKIIQAFKARLGLPNFPNVSNIVMFGKPRIKNLKELMIELGKNENIYNITRASGNFLYIYAYIRSTSELDYLISQIRSKGDISELTVGIDRNIPSSSLEDKNKLSDMDYLIIDALKNNSRKNISDISEELNISTKTVSRRLGNLNENNLVQYQIDWYPDRSKQIIPMFIIKLKPDLIVDDNKLISDLQQKYGSKILFTWSFSNLPNIKIVNFWSESMKEILDIETSLINDERFESVELTIPLEGDIFPTWIDKFLDDKINEIKKNQK